MTQIYYQADTSAMNEKADEAAMAHEDSAMVDMSTLCPVKIIFLQKTEAEIKAGTRTYTGAPDEIGLPNRQT